jgi:DNA modification methylase
MPETAEIDESRDLVYLPVSDLMPYPHNSRTHTDEQVIQVADSIEEFGFTTPILVDERNMIIAGHCRTRAAQKLGIEEVPCIVLDGLTDAQKRAYVIADNKLALNAGWDKELLEIEMRELGDIGFDLIKTGFSHGELAEFFDPEPQDGLTEGDDAPGLQEVLVSAPGDLWIMGEHRLLVGDATSQESMRALMGDEKAGVAWTDPPYNVNYEGKTAEKLKIDNDRMTPEQFRAFLDQAFEVLYGALEDGAAAYIAHADIETWNFVNAYTAAGFKLSGTLVWVKHHFAFGRADYHWQHEPILYGWKSTGSHRWYGGRRQTTLVDLQDELPLEALGDNQYRLVVGDSAYIVNGDIEIQGEASSVVRVDRPAASREHPTMKPVALIERQLINSARGGDLVLDPFGGSGSTLIAAHRLGMRARLMELDPKYADVIVRRYQEFAGEAATLAATGETFAEREATTRA